ncbi:transposase [Paenibacillus chitinolyticus]|uniref:Transposase n=1 Tax=Paenibacillus chitinolyticus TaxID=79263 RepID=A0A410WT94_9BACL|nr:RNA-guided endonuclease TnpB family protein [Paenibacillus chitinolyticus]MCY9588637.1 transposase [Paenibacillus chitinolyticus]MCY9595859.1 transposase [Paenibacillus chitinolyticus]QAV17605.1 transposase [Paenibacillus chitinolyticus]
MRIAFKFRLYPTKQQKEKIEFTLERCRLLYNRLLEERILAYKNEGRSLNYYDQAKTFTERKVYIPALKQVHSQVLQDAANRLDKAFQSFFRRVKSGETPGFPRFKPQKRYDSFTYPQAGYSIIGNKVRLSKIGDVKIKLHRQPQGKVKTCTITVKNGKYYVCFSCETPAQKLPVSDKRVGIDLGIKHLAITSDGQIFDSPEYLRKSENKLKQLQRNVSNKIRGSNRRKKSVLLLAKLHEKVANQRKDYAHKISRKLVNQYGYIAFEKLTKIKMLKNHNLAKSIADASWNQLVQFTTYKAESAGRVVVQVDPRNTSQECNNCGQIIKKSLSVRIHNCSHCGYVEDRDINAAKNILQRTLAVS